MGLLLAKSGRLGSSHKGWFSFWGPRHPDLLSQETLNRDLFIAASAFSIWIISEGKKLHIKGWWIALIVSISISFACGGPLFLYLRERKLIEINSEQDNK